MRKLVTVLAAVTAVASGVAVLQLKITVQNKQEEVQALAQQIHEDREAIRVLEAEWAYLTTPHVLQDRSIRFLALMPPRAKQIITDPNAIPYRPRGSETDGDPGVLLPTANQSEDKNNVKKKKQERGKERSL